MRAPHLYPLLRGFALGSFVLLGRELEEGAELPFAFEEHVERRGPSLYELKPLVRAFIEAREHELGAREDARLAVEELRREPAAAIFARAHAGTRASEDEALFRTVLLGLVDLDCRELRRLRLGRRGVREPRTPSSSARSSGTGDGTSRSRRSSASRSRSASSWHRASSSGRSWPASWRRTGPSPAVSCPRTSDDCRTARSSSNCAASSTGPSRRPEAAEEIADATSALRLTTMAAVAAGPVMFETLDGRPFGIQPVLPIAATQPPGESSRLDAFRAPIAVDVLAALGQADGDPELAEALDRWELSLFQSEPFRSEQVRAALHSLLGESWPMRACVLLAEDARSREELYAELTALSLGEAATPAATDAARRAVVAVLRSRDRDRLALDLDRELLGLEPRPSPRAVAV